MTEPLQLVADRSGNHGPSGRDLAAVFFRHQKLWLTCFLLVLLAGIGVTVLTPSYRAEMKILVRRGRIDPAVTPTQTAPPLLDSGAVSEEEMNSEADLLRDEDILRQVVLRTGLAQKMSWIDRLRYRTTDERIAACVRRLRKLLNIEPVRKSQLMNVSYAGSDPERSAAVLQALAEGYFARRIEVQRPSGQMQFFEEQMQESAHALDHAQNALVQFTKDHGVASAALQRDLTLQRLSEAAAGDLATQAVISEDTERVRSLETQLRDLPQRRVVQVRDSDNPQLQEKLKSKLLELELKRTQLLTKFQPSYRLVQEINQQIEQARASIRAEDLRPLHDETPEENPDYAWANSERMKALVEMQSLLKKQSTEHAQVATYQHEAGEFAAYAVMQSELESRLKAAEEKYLLYAGKREEARIGDALDRNRILNVTLAQAPSVPALRSWPLWTACLFWFAAACMVSTGTVFAADYLDPSLRTPDEVTRLLGTPVLVSLPVAQTRRKHLGGL